MKYFLLVLTVAATVAGLVLLATGQWLMALAVMFFPHMLFLWATLVPGCGWWGPVSRTLPQGNSAVWLTIDDGPDPHDTPYLLDLLREHRARATFFVIGEKARQHPDLIRRIASEGHALGNHTMTHPAHAFWRLFPARLQREIQGCQEILQTILGQAPVYFRAPAGMRNCFVHPILARLGLRLIGWSARGYDGTSTDPEKILHHLKRGLGPGAIILIHEGREDQLGNRLVRRIAPALLEMLKSRDLHPVAGGLQNIQHPPS